MGDSRKPAGFDISGVRDSGRFDISGVRNSGGFDISRVRDSGGFDIAGVRDSRVSTYWGPAVVVAWGEFEKYFLCNLTRVYRRANT